MPKMHINKSILINAPKDKIYDILSDFNQWTIWSPWLIMDPKAKVDVAEDAKSYSWLGDRVGSGNMKIIGEQKGESLSYDLNFLKPWKSYAAVKFLLKEKQDGTEVSWTMDSSLPFFMFWMKKMMVAFVGMDYERGLSMLKDYAEDGKVHSKLDFKGTSNYSGCKFIGYKTDCSLDEMGDRMKEDFTKIGQIMEGKKDIVSGNAFTIYHKWDMVKKQVSYTAGIPVNDVPSDLSGNLIAGEIPKTNIYTISHTGPYDHLGNAWSTLYNMERGKSFKKNKNVHPFEVYLNDPSEVDEKELITEVNFAVK